jgi:hypothetical protein
VLPLEPRLLPSGPSLAINGEVLIAIEGQNYSGVLATVQGTAWSASSISAVIEWGDGTTSTGTMVTVGSTVEVTGSHTFTHEGAYALAVQAIGVQSGSDALSGSVHPLVPPTPPPPPHVTAYAIGVAEVLAPTDHTGLQEVSNATASGGEVLSESIGPATGGGFTATVSGSTTYTLSELVNETGDTFSRTRTGSTFAFTLTESETGGSFIQPNSSLTLTVGESATESLSLASPLLYGTGSENGSLAYTLSQTGSGASYAWTESGVSANSTLTETLTTGSGTYVLTDTQSTAYLTDSGTNNATAGTYTMTASGTTTDARTQSGYAGATTFLIVRTSAGTETAAESGGFTTASFGLAHLDSGNYTLTESDTNPGGSSTASGTRGLLDGARRRRDRSGRDRRLFHQRDALLYRHGHGDAGRRGHDLERGADDARRPRDTRQRIDRVVHTHRCHDEQRNHDRCGGQPGCDGDRDHDRPEHEYDDGNGHGRRRHLYPHGHGERHHNHHRSIVLPG